MKATCRNGDEVELGYGDTYPPGHVGQHTSVTRIWFRVAGGEWCLGERSMHRTVAAIESSESGADLVAKYAGEVTT